MSTTEMTIADVLAADVTAMSYEQARGALLQVVSAMEGGGVPLADMMALWERGEALATCCQDHLDGAKARLAQAAAASHPDDAE